MKRRSWLQRTGPGLIVAATGLGAGDVVAAAVAGAEFGVVLLWAVVAGGLLKFVLNEGIARWQLVTGRTVLEGWIDYLPRFVAWYFLAYLVFWTFMVAAALMSATGLAAYGMLPALPVGVWGLLHSIAAALIVLAGGYRFLETLMKVFVGFMFAAVLLCAVLVMPPLPEVLRGLTLPSLPDGGMAYVLGIIGGVGGSVTILSYGYWMREAGWVGEREIGTARLDLGIAYGLTALFGIAIIVVSAGVRPEVVGGNGMALALADHLGNELGAWGKWVFLLGFYGAAFSSMIGVWHGVPYLFANFFHHFRNREALVVSSDRSITRSGAYRLYLLGLSVLPMSLLALDRPVWVVVLYAVTGALFMPLVAALLLYMNGSGRWLGRHANGPLANVLLTLCLLLFGYLLFDQLRAGF